MGNSSASGNADHHSGLLPGVNMSERPLTANKTGPDSCADTASTASSNASVAHCTSSTTSNNGPVAARLDRSVATVSTTHSGAAAAPGAAASGGGCTSPSVSPTTARSCSTDTCPATGS